MPRSLFNPKRVLLILAVLLLVNSVMPLWFTAPVGDVGRGVVLATLSPIAGMLRSMSTAIRPPAAEESPFDPEVDLIEQLRMANVLINKYEIELDAKREQLQRLMQSKEVLRLEGISMIDVRVTGYSGDRDNPVLTLNRGTAGDVGNRMAVVTGANFVGVIDSDRSLTADVRLITAPGSSLLVRIQPPTREAAARTAEYFLTLNDGGDAFVVDVPNGTAIAVGDIASLSDSQGRWPREATGYTVGRVVSVRPNADDPLRFDTVTVQPTIDLPRLSRVTVLKPVEE